MAGKKTWDWEIGNRKAKNNVWNANKGGVGLVHGPQSGSYANAVKRNIGQNSKSLKPAPSVVLRGNEICNSFSMQTSIFGQVRNVRIIPNLFVLLREEGFNDIQVRYVGGDWVYVAFESEVACSKFKKSTGLVVGVSLDRDISDLSGDSDDDEFLEKDIEEEGTPLCSKKNVEKEDGEVGEVSSEEEYTIHGELGAGFVDRKGRFFPTSNIKNGAFTGAHQPESNLVAGTPETVIPSTKDDHFQAASSHVVPVIVPFTVAVAPLSSVFLEISGAGSAGVVHRFAVEPPVVVAEHCPSDSLSQPPSFRRDSKGPNSSNSRSTSSHGSSKLLKKRVLAEVDDIEGIMKQYFEMGGLLGYDMENSKNKVRQILSNIGVIQVDQ
ncbi:unnamed protein product [Lactuca virosa]|uniref:Uncharacterized protein n=1 Tax=Lactuca virosa TaxID=75947 RepID=A0AAU9M6Q0_9ASTR|nr:unnamed protein product [Lactuca virosa]